MIDSGHHIYAHPTKNTVFPNAIQEAVFPFHIQKACAITTVFLVRTPKLSPPSFQKNSIPSFPTNAALKSWRT